MDDVDVIKKEYKAGEVASIDAIERLERLGLNSKEAEALVEKWDEA